MSIQRVACVLLIVAIGCSCSSVAAEVVRVDLLGGLGDFEYSGDTRWYSGYTGSDYDFDAESGWTAPTGPKSTWRSGYDPATPDNSVAVGWIRRTGPGVHPRKNVTYSIVPSTAPSGNCQFFCLKNVVGDGVYARLETDVRVRDDGPTDVHIGDTVTFRLDSIRMTGYDRLPQGSRVEYKIGINGGDEKTLAPSRAAFSDEISMVVPASHGKWVVPYVKIAVSGPLEGAEPGVYVDGAHLYVKRANDPSRYATWEVPVVPNKGIKTLIYRANWQSTPHDLYVVARNCDAVVLNEADGALAARLRYLNPNIRTYLYQIGTCIDLRDSRGVDPWYSSSPAQMNSLRKNNLTKWLVAGGTGAYGFVNEPEYPHSYYTRITDRGYQSFWVDRVKAKVLRWRHNGVFMDTIAAWSAQIKEGKVSVPQRDPWEVQSFLHATVPVLRSAGLAVIANIGGSNISVGQPSVFLDPRWSPTTQFSAPQYAKNSRSVVPDVVFQEWGFIRAGRERNGYYPEYWLKCLQDMDAIRKWNTSADGSVVSFAERIEYSVQVLGTDRKEDPAEGVDGWFQFGLASYLLGQNEFTSFSWRSRNDLAKGTDYSVTAKLATPDGERASVTGDPYFLYRRYEMKSGGTAVVVVNANNEPRAYVVDSDYTDESGKPVSKGTKITMKPHTGRIFTASKTPL